MVASSSSVRTDSSRPAPRRSFFGVAWRIIKQTLGACFDYRVTGLAGEAAFFALLSLPPLIFGLAGSIGYFIGGFGADAVAEVKREIVELARTALTEASIETVVVPSLDAVLARGRVDIISLGMVIALWSGSRALNVFIGAITIMYGLDGERGIVRTRALSFTLYVIGLTLGVIVIPLVLAGPQLFDRVLPDRIGFLTTLYWPTLIVLSSAFLATLYHLAVPLRKPWRYAMPGALVALGMWIGGGYLLRFALSHWVGGTSIYGPLAAPIVILLWLYLISISILIGAAFNAAWDAEMVRPRERARQPAFDEDDQPQT